MLPVDDCRVRIHSSLVSIRGLMKGDWLAGRRAEPISCGRKLGWCILKRSNWDKESPFFAFFLLNRPFIPITGNISIFAFSSTFPTLVGVFLSSAFPTTNSREIKPALLCCVRPPFTPEHAIHIESEKGEKSSQLAAMRLPMGIEG